LAAKARAGFRTEITC